MEGCAASAEGTKFNAVLHLLCRGIGPEKARSPRRRSEGEDEAEIDSLEDMMGNALKAAQRRTVKQCVFKSEVEGWQDGEGELPRGGQARPGGQP